MDTPPETVEDISPSPTDVAGLYERTGMRVMEGLRLRLYPDGQARREYFRDVGGEWIASSAGEFILEGRTVRLVLELADKELEKGLAEAFPGFVPPELTERFHVRRVGKWRLLVPEAKVGVFDARPSAEKPGLYRRVGPPDQP